MTDIIQAPAGYIKPWIIIQAAWHVRDWLAREHQTGVLWPEDDWYNVDDNVDLNLWTGVDLEGQPVEHGATLYPVIGGETRTTFGVNITAQLEEYLLLPRRETFTNKLRQAARHLAHSGGPTSVRYCYMPIYDNEQLHKGLNSQAYGQPEYWAHNHSGLSKADYLACRRLLERYKRYVHWWEEIYPRWVDGPKEYYADNSVMVTQTCQCGGKHTRRQWVTAPHGDACF